MKPQTNREKIQELANLLDETNLTEIELEDGGTRIRIARQVNTNQIITQPPIETQSTPVSLEPSQLKGSLTAPMVGRIYLAPEPGATQFCQVGDNVTQGQTLFIIEAMKTMNQIIATKSGIVKEIYVDDAQPVEYGETLALIE